MTRGTRKQKTRAALLRAAAAIAAEGAVATVPMAAERAKVSRATAYRHFPTQESLIIESSLPIPGLRESFATTGRSDLKGRVGAMVRTVAGWSLANETVLRETLRISLSNEGRKLAYRRPANRLELIGSVLAGAAPSLSARDRNRLTRALALLLGVDALIVLKDLVRLDDKDAIETLVWTATTLVEGMGRKA